MGERVRKGIGAGAVVALCILIGKIIGAAYKIPLVNILGAEGTGNYQLIFPVYAAAIAFTSGSSGIIISRNVAARRADGSIRDEAGSCILYTLIVSVAAAAAICLFSCTIANLQGNEDIRYCYFIIAPSVVFVGMGACLKGIFTGEGRVAFPAVCQLLEQGVKAAAGIILAYALRDKSITYGVMGAVAGVSISELVSLAACTVFYISEKERYPLSIQLKKDFFKENKFITAHGILLPLSSLADSMIIVKLLNAFGYGNARAMYGIMTGSVNTIINMPVVIALSAALTIIPAVSYNYALCNAENIKEMSGKCVKYVFFITCACFFGIYILSEDIVGILFSSLSEKELELAAVLMRISSVNVITASLSGVYGSILQAVDGSGVCLKYTALFCVLRVAVMIFLMYEISIAGAALSWVLYYCASAFTGMAYHAKFLGKDGQLVKNNGKIFLCGVIMCMAVLPLKLMENMYIRLSVSVIVGAVVYFAAAFILKVFERRDIKNTVFGRIYGSDAAKRREKWRN